MLGIVDLLAGFLGSGVPFALSITASTWEGFLKSPEESARKIAFCERCFLCCKLLCRLQPVINAISFVLDFLIVHPELLMLFALFRSRLCRDLWKGSFWP